ncbi:MAG: Riboflavin biosynthesis protein RibD [Elusimicrobia bacterium]|nr:Riboflavin biosynthesis protein RibD [Elusimicrobiota bacterium]
MRRALHLAAKGQGFVNPNPKVGCVIVKKGKIIGEGYHQRFGGPHAEILALAQAGSKAKGATMYLTLEPCTHFGKTPPCAPEILKAQIHQIYVAMKDPNPLVSGKGIQTMKKGGVSVHVGLEEEAAQDLNRPFVTLMTKKRPYVILKMALTLDGKIATKTGDSKWITSTASRRYVHALRSQSDAILVGKRTALMDKPRLTSHGIGRNPTRFVVTSQGKKKMTAKTILNSLARQHVSQLMVEGGGETSWSFIKENLVDELYFFVAPLIIGGRTAPSPVEGEGFKKINEGLKLHSLTVSRINDDILIHAYNKAA